MPANPTATLPAGIGNAAQAQQATYFLRTQPWYQQWLQQQKLSARPGSDPYGDITLSDAQRAQLLALARQHGIGIADNYEINNNGQIAQTPSHLGRNIAIGAGIGALALTGLGAAGIGPLAAALGGAGGAAGGAAAAAPVLGEAAGIAPLAAEAPIVGTALAAPTAAGIGTAAGAGAAAAAPVLASTSIGTGLTAPIVGDAGTAALAGADASAGLGGGGSTVANWLTGGGTGISPAVAGIQAGSNIIGAEIQSSGATSAAQTTADAQKYAAALADAANKRAEILLRQQAENQYQNAETARQANYAQWAAREQRISSLGQALGLTPRDIPAYVPGVDPNYANAAALASLAPSGTSPTSAGGSPTPTPSLTPTFTPTPAAAPTATTKAQTTPGTPAASDAVTQAVLQQYSQLGAPTTNYQGIVQAINNTGGLTPANQSYWFGPQGRIAQTLAGTINPAPAAATTATQPGAFSVPTSNLVMTPALAPGSLGSLAQQPRPWWGA